MGNGDRVVFLRERLTVQRVIALMLGFIGLRQSPANANTMTRSKPRTTLNMCMAWT